jgi:hypothetical protein
MVLILVMGKSQQGKSTLVKLLTGDESIACGEYGVGKSCTQKITSYVSKLHFKGSRFIDCVGTMDNDSMIDPGQLREAV